MKIKGCQVEYNTYHSNDNDNKQTSSSFDNYLKQVQNRNGPLAPKLKLSG